VRVTNRRNGRNIVVRVNDRGPFVRGRVIDITPAAARALGFSGLAPVTVRIAQN
jgi:rare lipoprotein A